MSTLGTQPRLTEAATRMFALRLPTVAIGLLWLGVVCAGCGKQPITVRRVEKESFDVRDRVRVLVSTIDGAIDVTTSDAARVDVEATIRSSASNERDAAGDLQDVEVTIDQQGDTVRVTARRKRYLTTASSSGVAVKVTVPRDTFARRSTSNAPVTVRGITGGLAVETSNGAITVREGSGEARLMTTRQLIDVEMSDARIEANTSNAAIRFRGSFAAAAQSFTTSNGRIEITLPRGAEFVLNGVTTHGKVASEFPIAPRPHNTAREVQGSTAKPGVEQPATIIAAETSNSEILIHRASPAGGAANGLGKSDSSGTVDAL